MEQKAIGGGMINRKRQDYNDVGWGIHDGNYQRFITQIDPESTSNGWWHKDPANSVYSRFARSIKTDNTDKAMFFDINDDFFHQGDKVELRIVWLDEKEASWEILYDAKGEKEKSALKVQNKNSGIWMEKTIVIDDAKFENGLLRNADIIIKSHSDEDAVFHMLEITKINFDMTILSLNFLKSGGRTLLTTNSSFVYLSSSINDRYILMYRSNPYT